MPNDHPGSASPSSERPAEGCVSECCGEDVADLTRGPTCVKCGARQPIPRVSQPSPGGSGGETTRGVPLYELQEYGAAQFEAGTYAESGSEQRKAAHARAKVFYDKLAARLSGDAAPRKEPFTDAELKALRDALWQASAAWDSCQCFRNECPHEAAYFAARKAFHDATFAGRLPDRRRGRQRR
jgi:hypothetical protein